MPLISVVEEPKTDLSRLRPEPVESRVRSLAKALSWRVTALAVTVMVVLVITGEVTYAAVVGGADALVKIWVYYLHERVWGRVRFGRKSL
jgi:adenylylsulfate kinase